MIEIGVRPALLEVGKFIRIRAVGDEIRDRIARAIQQADVAVIGAQQVRIVVTRLDFRRIAIARRARQPSAIAARPQRPGVAQRPVAAHSETLIGILRRIRMREHRRTVGIQQLHRRDAIPRQRVVSQQQIDVQLRALAPPAEIGIALPQSRRRKIAPAILVQPGGGDIEPDIAKPLPALRRRLARPNDPPDITASVPSTSCAVFSRMLMAPPSALRPNAGLDATRSTLSTAISGTRSQSTVSPNDWLIASHRDRRRCPADRPPRARPRSRDTSGSAETDCPAPAPSPRRRSAHRSPQQISPPRPLQVLGVECCRRTRNPFRLDAGIQRRLADHHHRLRRRGRIREGLRLGLPARLQQKPRRHPVSPTDTTNTRIDKLRPFQRPRAAFATA